MKTKFNIWKVLGIFAIIDISIWFLTGVASFIFLEFIDKNIGDTLSLISAYIMGIPLLISSIIFFIVVLIHNFISIIKSLLYNKVFFYIFLTILSLTIVNIAIGSKILSINNAYENKYVVPIVDINKNKIIVDITNYNNGDEKLVEIKKPLFINLKKGNNIYIYIDNNNYETAKYIVDYKYGITFLIIGYSLLISIIILMVVSVNKYGSKIK